MNYLKKFFVFFFILSLMIFETVNVGAVNYREYEGCEDIDFNDIIDGAEIVNYSNTYEGSLKKLYDTKCFLIKCKSDSNITLTIETYLSDWNLDLFDINGDNIKAKNYKVYIGSGSYDEYQNLAFRWNKDKQTSKVSATYNLKKGTYVAQVCSFQTGTYNINFTFKIQKSNSSIDKLFTIKMSKGECIHLYAGESLKWKSSNKSVAAVDNSGVVTAKKNGTATISASDGNRTLKIVIQVK